MSQNAISDHMGVSPGMVSQWASGHRPVPAQKAVKLGRLIGADPSDISADFREVWLSSDGSMLRHGDMNRDDIDALSMVVGVLASIMVVHRPAEAADAAAALRRRVPARIRENPLVRELIATLDKLQKPAN